MGPERLDKFIKDQVAKHNTPNDPELLWEKIQAKQAVEEKPKRRFLFWWFFFGFLLLGGLSILYSYQFSNGDGDSYVDSSSAIEQQTNSNTSVEKMTKNESTKPVSDNKDTTFSDLNINDKEYEAPTVNEGRTSAVHSKSSASTNDVTRSENVLAEAETTESNNDLSKAENTVLTQNEKVTQESETTKKTNNGVTVIGAESAKNISFPKVEKLKEPSTIKGENSTTVNTSDAGDLKVGKEEVEVTREQQDDLYNNSLTEVDSSKMNSSEPQVESENETSSNSNLKTEAASKAQGVDSTYTIESRPIAGLPKDEASDKNNTENEGKDDKTKKWHISSGASFTYGRAFRTLSDKESMSSDYLELRNEMETSLDAIRINLDLMAEYRSGLFLKSGLEYEQINERFDSYIEWDSMVTNSDILLAISYDMDSIASPLRGEGTVETTHWHRKKIYNRYRSIDIPLMVGYKSKRVDKRLNWFVEGGVSVNLWFKTKGEILNTDFEEVRLENKDNLFKTRTGISLIGAAGLSYQVANNISIWSSPSIKYRMDSVTSSENTLEQKYLNIGLNLGIRYHWF